MNERSLHVVDTGFLGRFLSRPQPVTADNPITLRRHWYSKARNDNGARYDEVRTIALCEDGYRILTTALWSAIKEPDPTPRKFPIDNILLGRIQMEKGFELPGFNKKVILR